MPINNKNRKYWIGVYVLCTIGLLIFPYLLKLDTFSSIEKYSSFLTKLFHTLTAIAIILLLRTCLEFLIAKTKKTRGERYNLIRIIRLLALIAIIYAIITSRFQSTLTFLTGLGIVSLILGFALQAPITSFIAWLYIIFRRPYHVGDRIQINNHRGDVVEISYLDTIILECSGDYVANDRQTGRLIHFPNSSILTDRVINYSGPQRPFIWNETAFQIAYTSDLQFVEKCLLSVAKEDFNQQYSNKSAKKWEPMVYFRTNKYSWMEVAIQYPVEPTDTTGKRDRILRTVLPKLNAQPDKVQFPQGASR